MTVIVGGLLVIIAVLLTLFATGHVLLAVTLSGPLTLTFLLLVLLWAAIWDSRHRWPELNWMERLAKIMFMERD
jgi:hypothetical protein